MIFYSPTGADHPNLKLDSFTNKIPKTFTKIVFWYDQHDKAVRNRTLSDLFTKNDWAFLKNEPNAFLLFFYPDEYYNWYNLREWATAIKTYDLPTEKIYIVCMDKNFENWTIDIMKNEFGIENFNISSTNYLLHKTGRAFYKFQKNKLRQSNNLPLKKFSIFSRNYQIWRLELFEKLFKNNVLNDSYYTFQNINPYAGEKDKNFVYATEDIQNDYKNFIGEHKPLSTFLKWIQDMPYLALNDTIDQSFKYNPSIFNMLEKGLIHLCIESHYDPLHSRYNQLPIVEEMSPAKMSPSFLTEKIYKPIFLKIPFIIISTPNYWHDMKKLGFKSFHPFINESYDTKLDNTVRMKYIVKEVRRLASLSGEELIELVENCKEKLNHNYIVATEMLNNTKGPEVADTYLQNLIGKKI